MNTPIISIHNIRVVKDGDIYFLIVNEHDSSAEQALMFSNIEIYTEFVKNIQL